MTLCRNKDENKKIFFLNKIKNVKIKYAFHFKAHFDTLDTSYLTVINAYNKV